MTSIAQQSQIDELQNAVTAATVRIQAIEDKIATYHDATQLLLKQLGDDMVELETRLRKGK